MAFWRNGLMTEEGKRIRQQLWNKQNNKNASEELYWSGSDKARPNLHLVIYSEGLPGRPPGGATALSYWAPHEWMT